MMRTAKFVLALPLIAALSGCVVAVGNDGHDDWHSSDWKQRQHDNRRHIDGLQTGMPYAEVRSNMGNPDFKESFQSNDDKVVVLFYRTNNLHSDGITTKDECTPLVFKNDRLSGWGQKAYDQL